MTFSGIRVNSVQVYVLCIFKLLLQRSVKDLLKQQVSVSDGKLSARERNKAKRKAKMLARQTSRENDKNGCVLSSQSSSASSSLLHLSSHTYLLHTK